MRARTVFPLLCSGIFLLLTALLILWGSTPSQSWASSSAWTDLQGPSGGPAQAIALNPNYPSDPTVLAGGGQDMYYASWLGQGIFRSLDGGWSWSEPGGPVNGALMDVAFSPRWQDDGLAVAAFWQGIWTTQDRGVSWQQISDIETGGPAHLRSVAVSSPSPGQYTLLAGGDFGGIYRSGDGGASWSYVLETGGVQRLAFDPAAPDIAFAATGTGLWRTTDAGVQWTRVTKTTAVYDVAVDAGGRTYASFENQAWRSEDGGTSWEAIDGPALQSAPTLGLSADGAGLFLAAGPHLYRYDMAANRVVTVTTDLVTGYIQRLALSPTFGQDNTVLAGNLHGVWISRDAGASFNRKEGFIPLPVRRVQAVEGRHDGDLFAAGKDGIWRHDGGGWHSLNTGILGTAPSTIADLALSPGYAQDHTLFAVWLPHAGLGSAFLRSTDGGQSWASLLAGKEYMNQVVLSPEFVQDRRLYLVAVNKLWSSNDGGDSMIQDPFWDDSHQVRLLAISTTFHQDQALVAAGDKVYRSVDAGSTWQPASSAPILSPTDGTGWRPTQLVWARSGRLYLSIYTYDRAANYARHDQIWTSSDKGQTWTQLTAAPDRPIESLATGPSLTGSGEALYVSTYDSNASDEDVLAPDLYASRDNGATWSNLGTVPGGPARLAAPVDAPDQVWAGSQGVWLLDARQAPTATPNPVQELLSNRSFEYTGVWRIPDTAYDAGYSQDQHYDGYWSMRTGITNPADNVHSYSDFSQDVTLPVTGTVTLRLYRWSQAGGVVATGTTAEAAAPTATTLDEFYRALDAAAGDLHYGLVIEQPSNKVHYLYARLDNRPAWEEQIFDLKDYLGKRVRLQFGTYNDGSGATALQYFDAFRLQAAGPLQPTPTAMPTGEPALENQMWLPYVENDSGR